MATQPTGVFDEVDLTVAPMAIEDVEKRLSALHELDKVRNRHHRLQYHVYNFILD